MASYHLSVKIVSRSKGRSGVAAAAYRSRSQIEDSRQGITFDYSKKSDLGHCEIMAPEHAPSWMLDRAKLWNAVEAGEKRKDAQIMREVEVALAKELSEKDQVELLREFCRDQFVNKGMVADICVHQGEKNPHAHIMLTMRKVAEEGFGRKVRRWNQKDLILKWREEWANTQNIYLAKAGFDLRVDHRSYAEQGIDVAPQVKRGITVYDRDTEKERTEQYNKIASENGARIIANPEIALEHITQYQSTFTHDDIIKYVHAHSDEAQFYKAVAAVTQSPHIVLIKPNEYERYNKYSTKTLLALEKQMLADAGQMGQSKQHKVKKRYVIQAAVNGKLSDEQKIVLRQTVAGGDMHAIIGHAGTGKSYTLKAIREAYEAQGYSLQGVCLSGVAAEGLEQSSGIKSATIHARLRDWQKQRNRLHKKCVLVIDEAGMVGTRQMQQLIAQAKQAGAKIIAVGDTKQTQAVEAGGAFRGIIERVETSRLSQVWRQKQAWQKEATRQLAGTRDDIAAGLDAYRQNGHISAFADYNKAASAMLTDYVKNYSADKTAAMIAHKNLEVERINLVCRHHLKKQTKFLDDKEIKIQTSTGDKYFSVGERVLFLRNERSLGVKNGTFGTVAKVRKNGQMIVDLGDSRTVAVDTHHYNAITYGYAATVHKLQGASIDRTYVLASEGFDRHLGYVALSRHREKVQLYYSQDKFQNYEHLVRKLANLGEKELLADHGRSVDQIDAALNNLTAKNATFGEAAHQALIDRIGDENKDRFLNHIVPVGQDGRGRNLFSTRQMIDAEQALFAATQNMNEKNNHVLDSESLSVAVNGRQLDDNQRFVIKRVATGSDLSIVNYQYGTDRKYVAGLIGKAYQEKGYVVEALSLSGMGAKNFESGSGISSATIFKKLWQWENGQDKLNAKSVIMIDNSNLIGTRQMRQVIEHADQAGAKVILFGQGQSLQAIDAGGAYRGIHAYGAGTAATLMRSEDNTGGWRQRAHDLLLGDTKAAAAAIDLYAEHGRIEKAGDAAAAVVDHWLAAVEQSKSYRNNLMIAYRNDDVQVLNRGARDRLIDRGYVDPSQNIKIRTYDKEALEFASGDRIVFLRKDDDMGIKNGSLGTVRSIAGDNLVIQVDGGQTVSVNVKLYNDLNYGYAASVYKSAGMSVDNTYIWATKHYNKHVVQAALSVHAKEAKIYHEFKDYRQVKETLSRSADKDLAADYPMDAKAYKITVQLREGSWPSQKYVRIEPHINKESEKQELTRQARAFAQQQALQMRLTAEEMKHISIKVKQIPIEKYQEMQKSKAISMDQGLKL